MSLDLRYRRIPAKSSGPVTVVTAQDRVLGATVVLKYAVAGTEAARRLRTEAECLGSLDHRDLVELLDRFSGSFGGERVEGFSTRWVDGDLLDKAISGMPLEERLRLFVRIADVVAYLHRCGLLHLDLKPANILVGDAGPVLIDLGSALPMDAAPGDAGGTLGFAAPEILLGQAATPAADLFGLGAILYLLLTDQPAYPMREQRALQQAVLSEDPLPIRVLRPDVSRPLARLVEDLLARDPAKRPGGVDTLRVRLAEVGAALPPKEMGSPRFVGRERERGQLRELLTDEAAGAIAVVGAVGSGRSRLARTVLREVAAEGRHQFVDLSHGDPVGGLHRLAALTDSTLPSPGTNGWAEGVVRAVRATAGRWIVYLGRRERVSPAAVSLVDEVLVRRDGAFQVVWAATTVPPGFRPLPIAPLDDATAVRIARFAGASAVRDAREVVVAARGVPGAILRALGLGAALDAIPAPHRDALHELASLPGPLPPEAIQRLPARSSVALDVAVDAGLARRLPDGSVALERLDAREAPADLLAVLRAVVTEGGPRSRPMWTASAALRTGQTAAAIALFDRAAKDPLATRADEESLLAALAPHHRPAVVALALFRLGEGRHEDAVKLLEAVPNRTPFEDGVLLRAYRILEDVERGIPAARALLARAASAEAWLDLAVLLARSDTRAAAEAIDEAERGWPDDARIPAVRLMLVAIALRRGEPLPPTPILDLISVAETSAEVTAPMLSMAGLALGKLGDVQRGERFLRAAVSKADQMGDSLHAAAARLNLGNLLQRTGRLDLAREMYVDGLAIARATGQDLRVLRLSYSLVEIELRGWRLPGAARYLEEFRAAAARTADPEATVRGIFLQGWYELAQGHPARARALFENVETSAIPEAIRGGFAAFYGRSLIDTGDPERALEVLMAAPHILGEADALLAAERGRAHVAVGRGWLERASANLPEKPEGPRRQEVGEILLAAAGEDLDPDSMPARRERLSRAATLLRGPLASRAATLRDRLLSSPGAALESIIQLTEALSDPKRLPEAVGRVVCEALGANRVLIMVRIQGLGTQVKWREISGDQAAGIGEEVMRLIQKPDDFLVSGNAFADPGLRDVSKTVRTFEIKSLVAVAIPNGDRAVGAIYVDDLHRVDRFTEQDVELLRRLAAAVGGVVAAVHARQRENTLVEPREVLGVLLADSVQLSTLETSIDSVRGQPEANVLVTGPTGAGKTWFARRLATEVLGLTGIEEVVLRKSDPAFLVSTLMGVRDGEYTNARARDGAVQNAIRKKRALFLDEIQSLDEAGQQVLLPLLELPHRRMGGLMGPAEAIDGPLHVILGTNIDVSGGRWQEAFRNDLWFRMSRVHIHLPPLADRGPEIVYQHLRRMLGALGAPAPEAVFDVDALNRVSTFEWPGNLRELTTFAEKADLVHRRLGRALTLGDLPGCGLGEEPTELLPNGTSVLDARQLETVLAALRRCGWVQADAARALDISPWKLLRILKRHGLLETVQRNRPSTSKPRGPRPRGR